MDDGLLQITNLTKTYGNLVQTTVLKGVDLQVQSGEFLAIIGPSGSGKSTMLNLIGALDRPTDGSIRMANEELTTMNDNQLAAFRSRQMGFVFQFHYLLPEFTAMENVLMPHWIAYGGAKQEIRERAEELVALVGLTEQANNMANAMSGGQQQRIAIARALMNRPSLILADEPTGNLDSEATERIYALLRQICDAYRTTFIVITHDRHIAARADRVVEMLDGEIVRDYQNGETPEEEIWETLAPSYCRACQRYVKKADARTAL